MVSKVDKHAARVALRDAGNAWKHEQAALAEARCRDALALDPGAAPAWALLGAILRRRDPDAAHAALIQALISDPNHADARFQLGNLYREQHRYADAVAAYEAALTLVPAHPALLNNLGLALEGADESDRAAAAYRSALAAQPGHRQSLGNLAHLLCRRRQYPEAERLCEEYLRRFPDADATIWVDRGICQHRAGDYADAETSFERARAYEPDDAWILTNLGSVLVDRGDFEHATTVLTQATERAPSLLYPSSLLAYAQAHLCAWGGLAERHEAIRRGLEVDSDDFVNAFITLSMPLSPQLQLSAARRWAKDHAARVTLSVAPLAALRRAVAAGPHARPLRLGYLSSDFREHPMVSLLAEVWERHDRTRLSTFAYSIGPGGSSPQRARIEAAFDRFVDCGGDTIEQAARRIVEDGIEVLIDLNGYTAYEKSEILALKPAPVQISWLGYLGTLGAEWCDYVLTDRFAAPPELQPFFSERFLYLPDCYCPSDTQRPVAASAPDRAACGLPEQGLVFCCFNNSYKILPTVFDVWMRLLRQVPDSVLWLAPRNATACTNLRREAAAREVAPERLVFAPRVSVAEHLARHVHADLFLDTTPYNAGTTANDALFMGVPVLTCVGATMVSRVAGSQLHAAGLPELVTSSLAEYEALALTLGREPARLRALRQRLAANRATYPLFDMPRFTRALDDLLLATWENRG
jgi:protein O-GlcNAc transferase